MKAQQFQKSRKLLGSARYAVYTGVVYFSALVAVDLNYRPSAAASVLAERMQRDQSGAKPRGGQMHPEVPAR